MPGYFLVRPVLILLIVLPFFAGLGAIAASPATERRLAKATLKLDVPFHKQEHALSCEIASLTSALRYKGVRISESDLLADLPFDPTPKIDNIWGNPHQAFVGDVDGKMPRTGYGVYWYPIAQLANKYWPAEATSGSDLKWIIDALHQESVVIVWAYRGAGRTVTWQDPIGERITAIIYEHTRIVTGYSGPRDQPTGLFLLDPTLGPLYQTTDEFLANWGKLGNSAIIVK